MVCLNMVFGEGVPLAGFQDRLTAWQVGRVLSVRGADGLLVSRISQEPLRRPQATWLTSQVSPAHQGFRAFLVGSTQ